MNLPEFIHAFEDELQITPGSVHATMRLADIPRFDSMGRLGFMAMIDTRLGIVVDAGAMDQCQTVSDLHALLGRPSGT